MHILCFLATATVARALLEPRLFGRAGRHQAGATMRSVATAQSLEAGLEEFNQVLPAHGLERFDQFCGNVLLGGATDRTNQTRLAEGQVVSQYYFPQLRAHAWWRCAAEHMPSSLPEGEVKWMERLDAARPVIAAELKALFRSTRQLDWRNVNDFFAMDVDEELMPETMALLDDLDGVHFRGARSVMIGRLAPDTRLRTHSDYYNYVLTAHLPLFAQPHEGTPATTSFFEYPPFERRGTSGMLFKHGASHEPWFDHANEPCDAILLDTSFEHTAFNDNVVDSIYFLHLDIWHPDLTAPERAAISLLDETYRKLNEEAARAD